MRTMGKRLCAVLLMTAVALSFVGCGKKWDRGDLHQWEFEVERWIEPELIVQSGGVVPYTEMPFAELVVFELDALYLDAQDHLYLRFAGEDRDWGQMVPYEPTRRMSELLGVRVREAYILRMEEDMFVLLLRDGRGRALLAYGWEDVSERDDYHSDDTSLELLCVLERADG